MKFLDHLEEWIITFLMGAATVIIFASVVHRYLSGFSIPGVVTPRANPGSAYRSG